MMDSLLAKAEWIQSECQDPEAKRKKQEEMKTWDDFTKLRKELANNLRNIREQIQERNSLMGKNDMGNTTTVKLGRDIRNGLKEVIKEADALEELQKKKQADKLERKKLKGKKIDPKEEEDVKARQEIVDLSRQHIEECRRLEKQVRGAGGTFFETEKSDATVTSLPDIEDESFQLLIQQDNEIDVKLDGVAKGVAVLKEMATEMGKEVEMQEVMIEELNTKVEKTNAKLINLNQRLKKTLEGVRKANRFCIDIILIVIILAIGGYLYNVFKNGV